jgi:hypothetical protein
VNVFPKIVSTSISTIGFHNQDLNTGSERKVLDLFGIN